MDPVSQGVLGATAALFVSDHKNLKRAGLTGAAAGMAPDLDILLQSPHDPLLALELHRQFTHSLLFIPIGGLVIALAFWLLFYRKHSFKPIYWYATAGYATHGLLDACTSYGTQLLWPFSPLRVTWDTISIIDFFVTLPLLIGVLLTCVQKRKTWIYSATSFFIGYMMLGVFQHHRAVNEVRTIAAQHAHLAKRVRAMPTIANVIVWRTLYEASDHYYVNAVAVPVFGQARVYPGTVIKKLNMHNDFPDIQPDSVHNHDVRRFRWFTENWLVTAPDRPDVIADLRYSSTVEGVTPLWGIKLDAARQNEHVEFVNSFSHADRDIIPWDKLFD